MERKNKERRRREDTILCQYDYSTNFELPEKYYLPFNNKFYYLCLKFTSGVSGAIVMLGLEGF